MCVRIGHVIEKEDLENPGCTSGEFLCQQLLGEDRYQLTWTHLIDDALVFTFERDAIAMARMLVPTEKTVVTEHEWG